MCDEDEEFIFNLIKCDETYPTILEAKQFDISVPKYIPRLV